MRKWLLLVVSMCALVVANIANAQLQPPVGGVLGNADRWIYGEATSQAQDYVRCWVYAKVSSGRLGRLKMVVEVDYGADSVVYDPVYTIVDANVMTKYDISDSAIDLGGQDNICTMIMANITLEVQDAVDPNIWRTAPNMVSWTCYPNFSESHITVSNFQKFTNSIKFDYEVYSTINDDSLDGGSGVFLIFMTSNGAVLTPYPRVAYTVGDGVDKVYQHQHQQQYLNEFATVQVVVRSHHQVIAVSAPIPLTTPPPTP